MVGYPYDTLSAKQVFDSTSESTCPQQPKVRVGTPEQVDRALREMFDRFQTDPTYSANIPVILKTTIAGQRICSYHFARAMASALLEVVGGNSGEEYKEFLLPLCGASEGILLSKPPANWLNNVYMTLGYFIDAAESGGRRKFMYLYRSTEKSIRGETDGAAERTKPKPRVGLGVAAVAAALIVGATAIVAGLNGATSRSSTSRTVDSAATPLQTATPPGQSPNACHLDVVERPATIQGEVAGCDVSVDNVEISIDVTLSRPRGHLSSSTYDPGLGIGIRQQAEIKLTIRPEDGTWIIHPAPPERYTFLDVEYDTAVGLEGSLDEIMTGVGATNRLRIVKQGSDVEYYINGRRLGRIDLDAFNYPEIGSNTVFVVADGAVTYSNLDVQPCDLRVPESCQ